MIRRATFVLVGVPLLSASPAIAQRSGLEACPDLRRGRRDPVSGMDCVSALQLALRDNGHPGQAVTGFFGAQTEANVLDFQRRRNLWPRSGIVGPKTRRALLGGPSPVDPPPVTRTDYSKHHYCESGVCPFYLRRATTREYAQWLDAHPTSGSIVSACELLKVIKVARPLRFICGVLGNVVADRVGDRLKEAARQQACLRLSIGLHSGGKPIKAAPDNTWRCSD